MNKLCKSEIIIISEFLETHEFMLFLRSNNIIYKALNILISWRKPYFIYCNPCSNYSDDYTQLVNKIRNENPGINCIDPNPEIRALLTLGKYKSTSYFLKPDIITIPYIFKNYFLYIPSIHIVIDTNLFINDKLTKYQNKINNLENLETSEKSKIHYFNKLLIWKTKMDKYNIRSDIYFKSYNQRIQKLLNK